VKKTELSGAEIHIDTLNIVSEAGTVIAPDMWHITCTANKLGKPDDRVIAVLCSSPFKEVADVVLLALKAYLESAKQIKEALEISENSNE
jgi:hypothetical protein